MAIDIDASSPAIVGSGIIDVVTTATFNPPDSSLMVATTLSNTVPTSITNNGAALTWTLRKASADQKVNIYTAPLTTGRTGMTVTATWATTFERALKVDVITGADLTTPIGATGTGTSSTNNVTVTGYSSTAAGSRGLCGANEDNNLGTPTSTDSAVTNQHFIRVVKAANTATAATSVTFNLDAAGSGTPAWTWAAVEVLPAPDPPRMAVYVANLTAVHRAANW